MAASQWKCPEGEAQLKVSAPHVVRIIMTGHVDAAAGRGIAAALHEHLAAAARAVHTFWDLEAMVNYHTEVRTACTRALLDNKPRVASVQTLSRSTLVKMGIAVANVALGGMVRGHGTRAEFEKALADALTA